MKRTDRNFRNAGQERWIEIVSLGIVTGIIFGILADVYFSPVVEVAQAEVVEPQKEEVVVQLEVVYNWDRETIERKIDEAFPHAPIMKRVAFCESQYHIKAFNPTNNSDDIGLFQISTKYHGQRTKALGLDMNDPIDNIAYAKILYNESGLSPWVWSKPCWNK